VALDCTSSLREPAGVDGRKGQCNPVAELLNPDYGTQAIGQSFAESLAVQDHCALPFPSTPSAAHCLLGRTFERARAVEAPVTALPTDDRTRYAASAATRNTPQRLRHVPVDSHTPALPLAAPAPKDDIDEVHFSLSSRPLVDGSDWFSKSRAVGQPATVDDAYACSTWSFRRAACRSPLLPSASPKRRNAPACPGPER
jgi:hypothetical protein